MFNLLLKVSVMSFLCLNHKFLIVSCPPYWRIGLFNDHYALLVRLFLWCWASVSSSSYLFTLLTTFLCIFCIRFIVEILFGIISVNNSLAPFRSITYIYSVILLFSSFFFLSCNISCISCNISEQLLSIFVAHVFDLILVEKFIIGKIELFSKL